MEQTCSASASGKGAIWRCSVAAGQDAQALMVLKITAAACVFRILLGQGANAVSLILLMFSCRRRRSTAPPSVGYRKQARCWDFEERARLRPRPLSSLRQREMLPLPTTETAGRRERSHPPAQAAQAAQAAP
jgi:hypothetical protein